MTPQILGPGPLALLFALALTSVTRSTAGDSIPTAVPLARAHAHNDYEHSRPLLDALDHGFCGVEADIHLVEGQLLVAHDRSQTRPEWTLERLYLKPLRERARLHHGRIYPDGPDFILLIDFKTEAQSTYTALKPLLHAYRDVLTEFRPDRTSTKAVTVFLSGNRPRQQLNAEPIRYAAIDGRLADLKSDASPHLIPLISDNWGSHFRWRGQGELSDAERQRLRDLVKRTHTEGRRIRFWAIPDTPEAWSEMLQADVDLINTDNLAGLQRFLLSPK